MKHRTKLMALSTCLLLGSTAAWAVGDPPKRMTQAQLMKYYKSIRPLLTADDMACPTGQRPVSGVISGGASPSGGQRQTVLTFSKGATVTVSRTWDRFPKQQITVHINCSS